MCAACDMMCCAMDVAERCGCDDCDCEDCWEVCDQCDSPVQWCECLDEDEELPP